MNIVKKSALKDWAITAAILLVGLLMAGTALAVIAWEVLKVVAIIKFIWS